MAQQMLLGSLAFQPLTFSEWLSVEEGQMMQQQMMMQMPLG